MIGRPLRARERSVSASLVAFESRRPVLGGALLAFAVLGKLSPGLLVVVLLVQRRHREVARTTVVCAEFLLLALLSCGTAPFIAFATYELPPLVSGEALPFLAGPESVVINLSLFGLPFELAALVLDVGAKPGRPARASAGGGSSRRRVGARCGVTLQIER